MRGWKGGRGGSGVNCAIGEEERRDASENERSQRKPSKQINSSFRPTRSFVYFLVRGSEEENPPKDGSTVAKKKKKGKIEVKLQRVAISISDDESSDEEVDENVERIAREVGAEMAGNFKKIQVIDEDEEEDEEDEQEVVRGRKGGTKGLVAPVESPVSLREFVSALLPVGNTELLRMGIDRLPDEEFDSAAIYDGAIRLATVLEPKIVKEVAEGQEERCNFFEGIIEHADVLVRLGGI